MIQIYMLLLLLCHSYTCPNTWSDQVSDSIANIITDVSTADSEAEL